MSDTPRKTCKHDVTLGWPCAHCGEERLERELATMTADRDSWQRQCDDRVADVLRLGNEVARKERQYMELIMSVETVFCGETRHQTALRYIRHAEKHGGGIGAETKAERPEGEDIEQP